MLESLTYLVPLIRMCGTDRDYIIISGECMWMLWSTPIPMLGRSEPRTAVRTYLLARQTVTKRLTVHKYTA